MIIPKGVKIRVNNKTYQDEIPDMLLTKKQLDLFVNKKKPNKSKKAFDDIEKNEVEENKNEIE